MYEFVDMLKISGFQEHLQLKWKTKRNEMTIHYVAASRLLGCAKVHCVESVGPKGRLTVGLEAPKNPDSCFGEKEGERTSTKRD
jgi:hypothetical protein